MTTIQAIDLLKGLEQSLDDYCELNDEGKTAFRMAITALEVFGIYEQLPSAQPDVLDTNVGDMISRQAAIELIENESRKWGDEYGVSDVLCDLADLPAAQPEKRTNKSTKTHACDCVSRQAAIDALHMHLMYRMGTDSNKKRLDEWINNLPSAQPEKRTEKRTETHACDLIDRQAAIDAVSGGMCSGWDCDVIDKLKALPSAQPELAQDLHNACTDAISRQAAIEVVDAVWSVTGDKNVAKVWDQIKDLPSAQPDDWMERNKERILQAGMEGREIEFRIGGRLFAIREKAQ